LKLRAVGERELGEDVMGGVQSPSVNIYMF
jgi:hypothetical protein